MAAHLEPDAADDFLEAVTDDLVLPFQINALGCRGRVVRLGEVVTDILNRHRYPEPVAKLLAEALALTAMLGTTLKFDGKLSLQTKSDGPCDLLVVDYMSAGTLRAYAHFDAGGIADYDATDPQATANLLGCGHLALTIDQGANRERYQGIVPLDNNSLSEAAHTYFKQSEQIPTNIHLAAGPVVTPGIDGPITTWRAGGVMIQHLPELGGVIPPNDLEPGEVPDGKAVPEPLEDDRWTRAKVLMDTVEDHELLDPTLSLERLIYRFYHDDGVRVFPTHLLRRDCQCSRKKVENMLGQFDAREIDEMVEDGRITVTCEFCSESYLFDPGEFSAQ